MLRRTVIRPIAERKTKNECSHFEDSGENVKKILG
jgi:hypothetical protein